MKKHLLTSFLFGTLTIAQLLHDGWFIIDE